MIKSTLPSRPSERDTAHHCAMSIREPEIKIDDANNLPAREGQAGHAAAEAHILGTNVGDDQLHMLATDNDIDEATLGKMFGRFRYAFNQLSDAIPNRAYWVTEQDVEGPFPEGRLDFAYVTPEGVELVMDWKFGWLDGASYIHQLTAYVANAAETWGWPPSGVIVGAVVFPRTGALKVKHFTRGDIEKELADDAEVMRRYKSGLYSTGKHCDYCKRRFECAALRQRNSMALSVVSGGNALEIDPSKAREQYELVKTVEKVCADFRSALRGYVMGHGPIDAGNGKEFRITESERADIDTKKALPLLRDYGLTNEELNAAMKLVKKPLEKAIKSKAPPKKKQAAWDKFNEELEEKGAISRTIIKKLELQSIEATEKKDKQ